MSASNLPEETGLPRRITFTLLLLAASLVAIWVFVPRNQKADSKTAATDTEAAANTVSDRECERRLQEVLDGLHPERIVVSSNRADRTAELGQWMSDCGRTIDAAAVAVDESANAKWLSGPALERVSSANFSLRDAHFLTLARLLGEVALAIAPQAPQPAEQVTSSFEYLIRETQFVPDAAINFAPRTPLESLLMGQAKAADRAWAFGELLRQFRIDAVIIEPVNKPDAWLIGVLKPEGDCWLFDPRLGMAIPAADDDPQSLLPRKAATLREVQQDASLLRKLDTAAFPYALQGDDLASVSVKMIGHSSVFATRMARIQNLLTIPTEIFDGLGSSGLRTPGLAERVISAGKGGLWTAENVSVWPYPEQQLSAFIEDGAEGSPAWQPVTELFSGPTILNSIKEQEDQSRLEVMKSRNPLREVRMIHLKRNFIEARKLYMPIRTARRPTLLPSDQQLLAQLQQAMPLNAILSDYACYWSALCQFELGRFDIAQQTLQQYRQDFPLGLWSAAIPELQAQSLLGEGQPRAAIETLEALPPRQMTPRLALMISRLKGEHRPAAPQESPATPAPAAAAEPAGATEPPDAETADGTPPSADAPAAESAPSTEAPAADLPSET